MTSPTLRTYTVGLPDDYAPMVLPCAANLQSFTSSYPPECRKPGALVEMFDLLIRHAQLNFTTVQIPLLFHGTANDNGSFDGIIGHVQRGDIDMALMIASPTEIIDETGRAVVSILRPLETGQPAIVVPSVRVKTMTDKAATFLQPFDLKLWVLIFILLVTIWLLAKTNWHFLCAHKRLLALCAIGANLHILNLYKASLVSAYLVKLPTFSLHTFDQVITEIENHNAKLTMQTRTHYNYLKGFFNANKHTTNQWDRFARAVLSNPPIIMNEKTTAIGDEFINTGRAFRFLLLIGDAYELLKENCNLRLIDVPFESGGGTYGSLIVNANQTELTQKLNSAMDKINIRTVFHGIHQRYHSDFLYLQSKCAWHAEHDNDGMKPVSLQNISGVIFVFATIVILSLFIFFLELLRVTPNNM